jgi:hypothetical protein
MSTKPLVDGEIREIKAGRGYSMWKHNQFKVSAERYDCDTPIVHLEIQFGVEGKSTAVTYLTDDAARDLIDRLERALRVLPTSK